MYLICLGYKPKPTEDRIGFPSKTMIVQHGYADGHIFMLHLRFYSKSLYGLSLLFTKTYIKNLITSIFISLTKNCNYEHS